MTRFRVEYNILLWYSYDSLSL